MRPFFGMILIPFGRSSVTGQKNVPRSGPVLILSNHVTWLDPVWISYFSKRPVRFLASAIWFKHALLGPFLEYVGAIPKMKFTKDPRAVEAFVQFGQQGDAIALFPEGERNWNGRTRPVLPGIGRLVRRLDVPVICVQIQGGHQMWPRWSVNPRSAPLYFTFGTPKSFPKEASNEEIEAWINEQLMVRPDDCPEPSWTYGKRLADGLPNALWACPQCLKLEALKVDAEGAAIHCEGCGAGWTVMGTSKLQPLTPQARAMSVAAASEIIEQSFGNPPRVENHAQLGPDVVLQGGMCELRTMTSPKTLLHKGKLRLTTTALQLVDDAGAVVWQEALQDLKALSIEAATLLTIRTEAGLLELDPLGESRVKWDFFVRPYLLRVRAAMRAHQGETSG